MWATGFLWRARRPDHRYFHTLAMPQENHHVTFADICAREMLGTATTPISLRSSIAVVEVIVSPPVYPGDGHPSSTGIGFLWPITALPGVRRLTARAAPEV